MLSLEKIVFGYSGQSPLLFRGIDFCVDAGEYVAVTGPNGSGKTTLARLLKGLLMPTKGIVRFKGTRCVPGEINQRIGYIFAHPEDQFVSPVVENDVAFGPENQGKRQAEIEAAVCSSLDLCEIGHLRNRHTHHLSAGEQQKVNMAGILAMNVDLIVFDEAVSMLDASARAALMETLRELKCRSGIGLIHITHCLEDILRADRVYVLNEGVCLFDGPPRRLLAEKTVLEGVVLHDSEVAVLVGRLIDKGLLDADGISDVGSITEEILSLI